MATRPVSWSDARDRLHQLRDKQERASLEVVQLAESLLETSASKLGDEGIFFCIRMFQKS